LSAELARTAPDDVSALAVGATGDDVEGGAWPFLAGQGFEGKRGDVRVVSGDDGRPTFVVGLGPAAEVDAAALRHAAGCLARAASRQPSLAVDVLGRLADGTDAARGAQAVVEGLALGGYRFTTFKSEPEPSQLAHVV